MTDKNILGIILRNDPDGKTTKPTEGDYAAFKNWVIRTYGRKAWDDYMNWGK